MAIHSNGHTVFSLSHIEEITLGAGDEVDKPAGGASGTSVDRIGEVSDRASEGQDAGVYGGRFYSKVSGKERSQGRKEGNREQD